MQVHDFSGRLAASALGLVGVSLLTVAIWHSRGDIDAPPMPAAPPAVFHLEGPTTPEVPPQAFRGVPRIRSGGSGTAAVALTAKSVAVNAPFGVVRLPPVTFRIAEPPSIPEIQPLTAYAPTAVAPVLPPRLVLEPSRPELLVPMYVAYGVLQAADAHSTLRGLSRGAREQNPVLGEIVNHPGVLISMKAGTTVATVLLVERLRERNPVAAIAVMAGVNTAYALIVHHNYQVGNRK